MTDVLVTLGLLAAGIAATGFAGWWQRRLTRQAAEQERPQDETVWRRWVEGG